jgi:hypothetical protein
MNFPADRLHISGETVQSRVRSFRGGEAVRNRCADCGSLVFGGNVGQDKSHTVYAGSLDDASLFEPRVAIFLRDRAAWAELPVGLAGYDTLPG